jgi:CheY-like chemotaxis protein
MTSVLVVAEETAIRRLMASVLEGQGYAVATASTATDAYERLRTSTERLVAVFDYHLPDGGMGGGIGPMDILRLLIIDGEPLHRHGYVLLTERDLPPTAEAEAAAYGVWVLSIPFSIERLLDAVRWAERQLPAAD